MDGYIAQKILNQSYYLGECSFFEKSQSIMELYNGLEQFDPSNREGHSARIYFNTLFGNDFTRESDNDVNAALDYGYTLLLSMFAREVVVCGCMTQIGLSMLISLINLTLLVILWSHLDQL